MGAYGQAIHIAGPGDESGPQDANLFFDLSYSNEQLFTANGAPAIDPATGDLTYTLAHNANGTATIGVVLKDGSAVPVGGWMAAHELTIEVRAVNDAPSFVVNPNLPLITINSQAVGGNQKVDDDAGQQTVLWATDISAGPDNENGQTANLSFVLSYDSVVDADGGSIPAANLFSVEPAIE